MHRITWKFNGRTAENSKSIAKDSAQSERARERESEKQNAKKRSQKCYYHLDNFNNFIKMHDKLRNCLPGTRVNAASKTNTMKKRNQRHSKLARFAFDLRYGSAPIESSHRTPIKRFHFIIYSIAKNSLLFLVLSLSLSR